LLIQEEWEKVQQGIPPERPNQHTEETEGELEEHEQEDIEETEQEIENK